MPGPALHERSVQAAVKTVKTNCVCSGAHCAAVGGFAALRMRRPLYGEGAPLAVANFEAVPPTMQFPRFVIARPRRGRGNLGKALAVRTGCRKNAQTDCVCSGAQRAPLAVANFEAVPPAMQVPRFVIARSEATWQSRAGSYDFAAAFLSSSRVLRDSHVASLLGMTRQAGAAVHQSACTVECSPTGRSGNAATLACAVGDRATKPAACKAVTDRRYRRNWRVPF